MKSAGYTNEVRELLGRAREVLDTRFGHDRFLDGQESALASVFSLRNLLVVMPTGAGKSLVFQLPALLDPGLTLVVSPLIALMKDQVDELRGRGFPASFVNSSLDAGEQRRVLEKCGDGEVKLLYVAPERFRNAAFLEMLDRVKITRMAVDEAHCISEWGHDFRPDYRRLKSFRERAGNPPVTALTATATVRVQDDIIASLGLEPADVDLHVHGFDRPNLAVSVVEVMGKSDKDDFLKALVKEDRGTGIIYTGTRKAAEKVAAVIGSVEPRTSVYHAGMEPEERAASQNRFFSGEDRIVVATTAFGMGIDKTDVRFVVHYNYPGSVEQYYQEIGRAGRDGLESRCILLYMPADRFLREYFIDLNYPDPGLVESVYHALWSLPENPVMKTYREIAELCEEKVFDGQVGASIRLFDGAGVTRAFTGGARIAVTFDRPGAEILSAVKGSVQKRVLEGLSAALDLDTPGRHESSLAHLCSASELSDTQVRRALFALDEAGLLKYEPPFRGRGVEKRVEDILPFGEISIDWEHQELLRGIEEEKLEAMEAFIRYAGCRRESILRYFGEKQGFRCGMCDRCLPGKEDAGTGGDVFERRPRVALVVLICVHNLRFPLGKTRIAQVVCGSKNKDLNDWGLVWNPAHGLIRAKQDDVKKVIDDLVREGYLQRGGEPGFPVLVLTDKGTIRAESADLGDVLGEEKEEIRTPRQVERRATDDEIRNAALRCVDGLKNHLGLSKLAGILGGSRAKWVGPLGADRLDVYGSIGESQDKIRDVIRAMLKEGLVEREGDEKYPVIGLTGAGRRILAGLGETGGATPGAGEGAVTVDQPRAESDGEVADGDAGREASDLLGGLVQRVLASEREQAGAVLPSLRLFHPREIVARVESSVELPVSHSARSRAVWIVGELCGAHGLDYLVRASDSGEEAIRRLAGRAIGKAMASLHGESAGIASLRGEARLALDKLCRDPDDGVRRAAEKAREAGGGESWGVDSGS